MNHPHACTIPPNLLGYCHHCGQGFIRRDEGAQAVGFCCDSCQLERQSPHPHQTMEPKPLEERDR